MCTVTFIAVEDKIFITSNRDEKNMRKKAIPPATYFENCQRIMYPRDAEANGSWIAINEKGYAAVLLNGGFVKHVSKPPYKKSRGIIFLEIIQSILPVQYFTQMDLMNIEPFTMIIYDGCLHEYRWTGTTKNYKLLNKSQSYIWSSATLYDENTAAKRAHWFANFLDNNPLPTQEAIFKFHLFTGDGDKENDLNMNRNDLLSTVSVTGIELANNYCKMKYADLSDNNVYETAMILNDFAKYEYTF